MLRRGDSGAQVKAYQQKLKQLGYYSGALDGIFGPLTEQAVKKFQAANGLQVDGIIGPKTKAALAGGGSSSSGGSGTGGATNIISGGLLDKVVGGILLYGVFKVLMKIF